MPHTARSFLMVRRRERAISNHEAPISASSFETPLTRLLSMRVRRGRVGEGTTQSCRNCCLDREISPQFIIRSRSFPGIVPKRDKTQTVSATIRADVNHVQTITVITLLALLTISGAVISDRILTGEAQTVVAVRF